MGSLTTYHSSWNSILLLNTEYIITLIFLGMNLGCEKRYSAYYQNSYMFYYRILQARIPIATPEME